MNQAKSQGFTIIEVFIALLIMGVVVVLAVPSFAAFMERQRVSAQAEAISGILRTARTEATTKLATVDVCWNQGNAARTESGFSIQPGQMAILVGAAPAEVIRDITFSDDGLFIDDTDNDDCVSFTADGRFNSASATGGTLVFGVCTASGETADSKAVIMNATGRASTVNNDSGTSINCS